jgi:nitrate/nitrite transport system ATP-binding protein
MSDARAFIDVAGVSKAFPTAGGLRPVLHQASFTMARGEFVSIVGAMGSGKSTLLGILAGLIRPDAGSVSIAGTEVRDIQRHTSVVFQNYSLLPWLTALENVRLAVGSAFPDLSRTEQRARAQRTLEMVGLGNAVGRRPAQLSGGMRQRVAIARALSTDPDVLLLDDPFGALDALTRESLQQELMRLGTAEGRTVTTVMITNNVEEAILLSDRIVPMIPGPPATLGGPLPVDLPRPRTASALQHDDRASHVRADVIATLTASMSHRRRLRGAATDGTVAVHEARA